MPARSVAPCKVPEGTLEEKLTALMSDLNTCSKKGLSERFDSTIGAGTVLMPFGGRTQLTPVQAMAAKLPVPHGETKTCSGMAWGYNPFIAEQSEYHSAYLAVAESVSKLVATGFSAKNAYLTFQEYFERLGADPTRWGRPMASLLGALDAQVELGVAAIGGKDSMSGSFENIDVPPTLVSFAVAAGNTDNVVSPEFKLPGSKLVLLSPAMRDGLLPNAGSLKLLWAQVETLIKEKKVLSAYTPVHGRSGRGTVQNGPGQPPGRALCSGLSTPQGCSATPTAALCWSWRRTSTWARRIGETTARYVWELNGETADLAKVQEAYEAKLEPVLPYRTAEAAGPAQEAPALKYEALNRVAPKVGTAKPRVLIPVFPGTNCEYDSARAMERAGAEPRGIRHQQPHPGPCGRERGCCEGAHRAQPDDLPAGRLLRRRRAGGQRQVHHGVFPQPGHHRGRARAAAKARRPDAGHLQRLPGAHQAGPCALRRYRGDATIPAPR